MLPEGFGKRGYAVFGLAERDDSARASVQTVGRLEKMSGPHGVQKVFDRIVAAFIGQNGYCRQLVDHQHIAVFVNYLEYS